MVAPYVESPGMPTLAAMVLTLTMLPRPRSTMPGTSAAVRKYGARTLTANAASKDSTSCATSGAPGKMPALLTRIVDRPAASASERTESRSCEVGRDEPGAAAVGGDLLDDGVAALRVAAGDDDVVPLGGEQRGGGGADAAG